ncbi:SAC3 domain-containing protein 1 [Battus philenor]|uniref:SAC3 domain-containing protein 1 n=1 Tax=Battus philenor TaxID=42288 RepID=UPI0035CFDDBF
MSYCEGFYNNTKNNDCIRGTCNEMCPPSEKNLRVREGLVHVLEAVNGTSQLVKCYSRSAADMTMAVPSLLRPFPVLKETIQHLLLKVTCREDVSASCLYDFVNDRLRAVRQDMTIQRLQPLECMQLLEPMIRFHVWFGYQLSDKSLNKFDPVLNRKYLLECIKWFLYCCDVQDRQGKYKTCDVNSDELTVLMSNWIIDKESINKLTCDRILVEGLYVLCNLEDMNPLYRYLTLPTDVKSAHSLRLIYEIALANLHGNFVRLCRLAERLCPLSYCALCLYLPMLQRKALKVMSHGYSSKQLVVPTDVVCRWLAFDNLELAALACQHYGLQVDRAVHFHKDAFKSDVDLIKSKKKLNTKGNISIQEILTYRSQSTMSHAKT